MSRLMKSMKIGKYKRGNKREDFLQLRLRESGGSKSCQPCVVLELVNEVGEALHCGNLITFWENGTMTLNMAVNTGFPFPLNKKRQLDFTRGDSK